MLRTIEDGLNADTLSDEETRMLCRKAQQGDKAAEQELVLRYTKLAKYISRRFAKAAGQDTEDVFAQALEILVKVIRSYNPGRGAFISYARLMLRSRLLDMVWKRRTPEDDTPEETDEETRADDDGREELEPLIVVVPALLDMVVEPTRDEQYNAACSELKRILDAARPHLTREQWVVVRSRADGRTMTSIAQRLGMSRETAYCRLREAMAVLEDFGDSSV